MAEKTSQRSKRIEKKGGYGAGTKAVSELKPPPKTPGVGTKTSDQRSKGDGR